MATQQRDAASIPLMPKLNARRLAAATMNDMCSSCRFAMIKGGSPNRVSDRDRPRTANNPYGKRRTLFTSKVIGVGQRLVPDQNGMPLSVLASGGKLYSSCRIE